VVCRHELLLAGLPPVRAVQHFTVHSKCVAYPWVCFRDLLQSLWQPQHMLTVQLCSITDVPHLQNGQPAHCLHADGVYTSSMERRSWTALDCIGWSTAVTHHSVHITCPDSFLQDIADNVGPIGFFTSCALIAAGM
jgi:hypothetical protein